VAKASIERRIRSEQANKKGGGWGPKGRQKAGAWPLPPNTRTLYIYAERSLSALASVDNSIVSEPLDAHASSVPPMPVAGQRDGGTWTYCFA
jgi:hypothetical protein